MPAEQRAMVEQVPLERLSAHPRNYRTHPDDQIAHLIESIREHGFYRNIVIARDGTILAGHGTVEAARRMGFEDVPAIRLDIASDDPRALKVLTGDNSIGHLADVDDRALTELLREIKDTDLDGLLGTGFDEMMLANLVFVTRPASEVQDFDEAAHWAGMPEYEPGAAPLQVTLSFRDADARAECARVLGLTFTPKTRSAWWPPEQADRSAPVRFESGAV